jgi:hypothetical protein
MAGIHTIISLPLCLHYLTLITRSTSLDSTIAQASSAAIRAGMALLVGVLQPVILVSTAAGWIAAVNLFCTRAAAVGAPDSRLTT